MAVTGPQLFLLCPPASVPSLPQASLLRASCPKCTSSMLEPSSESAPWRLGLVSAVSPSRNQDRPPWSALEERAGSAVL